MVCLSSKEHSDQLSEIESYYHQRMYDIEVLKYELLINRACLPKTKAQQQFVQIHMYIARDNTLI